MTPEEMTSDWLSHVREGPVESVAASPIGDGHVSTTLRLSLTSDDPDIPSSIVAKVPAEDDRSRLLAASVRSYECEVKLFRELAPTVDIRMPHCYHGEWDATTNDYVVLLEDMSPAVQGDQLAGCSPDRAELAVRELTRLHGPRWNDPTLSDIEWLAGNDPDASADGYSLVWSAVFPGFAGELAVTNPGDEPATVVIDLHTPDGPGLEAATITIPPNEPFRLNLADLAAGAFGVRLQADRSVAAVLVADDAAGVAATTGARAAAVRWLLPGAGTAVDAVTTLWVLNPFEEQATVTIQALGPDAPPAEKVIVGPGAVRQVVAAGPGTVGYSVEGSVPLVVSWSVQAPRGIALVAGVPVGG